MLRDIATSMNERILHFKARMTKLTLLTQCHMEEKENLVQVIRLKKEGLTRARSDATIVKAGVTLQINMEVQM